MPPTPAPALPGPIGVLAPSDVLPPAAPAPFPGPLAPLAPPKTQGKPPGKPSKPPQPAFPGPFAPTPTPNQAHKTHTHYVGPFAIDDDDNEEAPRPPHADKDKEADSKGGKGDGARPAKPAVEPQSPDYEDEEEQHYHHAGGVGPAGPTGPYYPVSPDKKNVNPEYQIVAVVPHNVHQGAPQGPPHGVPQGVPHGVPPGLAPYQPLPPHQGVPHRGEGPPRRPTPEELLYLQHVHGQDGVHIVPHQGVPQGIRQGVPQGIPQGVPQGVPHGAADLFLLHNHGLQGDKVYHVGPDGPDGPHGAAVPPELEEQIIAHLREHGALGGKQPQQPPARPVPHPFPPHHGQGLGLEHEDDLATDTSRHPALHQQLAQLLGNHSYSGWSSMLPLPVARRAACPLCRMQSLPIP